MPKKLKALLRDLTNAGYVSRGGKGSHANFEHACGHRVLVSIHSGEAKNYQQRDIEEAVEIANRWAKAQPK